MESSHCRNEADRLSLATQLARDREHSLPSIDDLHLYLGSGGHLFFGLVRETVGFLVVGISTRFYVACPCLDRVRHYLSKIRILPHEPRLPSEGHPNQIVQHENLDIAFLPR